MSDVDLTGVYNVFMFIWSILDAMFSFIENSIKDIFNAIPVPAIPFLIGIFSYSIIAFLLISINNMKSGKKVLILKIFHKIFLVFVILFSIWRIGLISMLDNEISVQTFAAFFINLIYIMFAIVLFISFYRQVPWIGKVLLILVWSMFLLLTFVICPATSDFQLSNNTLIQVLLVATLFVVPNSILAYQKSKKGSGDGDDE